MSGYQKILDHPDKNNIISKLASGESAASVSEYLKLKYSEKDQKHLRLSSKLLSDFIDKYLNQYEHLEKIVSDQKQGKLDKKLAASIINNKTWNERLAEKVDAELDIKLKVMQVLTLLEARAEQVFDSIQENPANFKGDYVLIKYFELLFNALEKCDKVVNERPDQVIEHNYSIKLVERHSVVLQNAIREVLSEMDPDIASLFLDKLSDKLRELEEPEEEVKKTIGIKQVENLLPEHIEAEFQEL